MKERIILTSAFVLTLTAAQLFAGDGARKGFIVGGGIGGGYMSNDFSIDSFSNRTNRGALLTEFKIGHAPSNSLEIYFVNKSSFWRDTFFQGTFFEGRGTAVLSLSGVGVTKHLTPSGCGFFVNGGGGLAVFDSFRLDVDPSVGFGLFGGIGYEFAKHWSVQAEVLYLNIDKADISDPDSDLGSASVRLSLNFLSY